MNRNSQSKKKPSGPGPQQEFYHSEEVLNSEHFFLVGRGGHGNFHRGNRAVRTLVADHATSYVSTARKDRAQISSGLYDNHELFQTLLFVTPRDYVLPRLEKDEEATSSKQAQRNKAQGIILPNGATIPPTIQKRWLSRTRTQSIIEQHGGINNIRAYPRGVYIEVGRDWAIDIIDHLCREQAHEIRKNQNENGETDVPSKCSPGHQSNEKEQYSPPVADPSLSSYQTTGEEYRISSADDSRVLASSTGDDRHAIQLSHHAFASPDMMEAVEGLSALMKSEGSNEPHPKILPPEDHGSQGNEPKANGEDNNIVICGGEIASRFPGDVHFVCGCVGFSVLDNPAFLKLIESYYHEQIDSDNGFRRDWDDKLQRLKVRRHVPAILARAHEYAKSHGKGRFRLWTAQRDGSNGKLQRLSEEVWAQTNLVEITDNTALLKQRLESPLRSILMTLKRHPGLVGSKDGNSLGAYASQEYPSEIHGESSSPDATPSHDADFEQNFDDFSRKRMVSENRDQLDWRTSLPRSTFEPSDLGEPPNGWLFCKERALQKLSSSTEVSVVVSNSHCDGQSAMENHFVWEAASRWRKELPAKRFIFWFDASSEESLYSGFDKFTRSIRHDVPLDKRTKTELAGAVHGFYQALGETRSGAEFFLVFSAAPDPTTFAAWVLPQHWFDSNGTLIQDFFSAIVVVPKQQSPYRWNSDVFKMVEIHMMHRIPDKRWKDEKPWWCELPLPNLPPMFSAEIDPSMIEKVRQALDMDGSLVALLGKRAGDQTLPSVLANQFVRKWMMEDPSARFGLWLSTRNEEALRKSYIRAISSLTRLDGLDEMTEDISPQWLARELMALLMQVRKFVPRFQWVIVFESIPANCKFEEWFFPSDSEWWNSRGRFAFTSCEKETVEVRVGMDGKDHLTKVPAVALQ